MSLDGGWTQWKSRGKGLKTSENMQKKNLLGSMDSILLNTENSCEAQSPFQIYLFWMKIYGSSFIKLTKKIQKSNPPPNVQIYIPYLIWDI